MVFKKANVNIFIERPQVESILQDITWPQRWAQWTFIYINQLWMITVKQILVQMKCPLPAFKAHLLLFIYTVFQLLLKRCKTVKDNLLISLT